MMVKKILLFLLLFPLPLLAQVSNPGVIYVSAAPSGACAAAPPVRVVVTTGTMYTCNNGTWAAIGGGSNGFPITLGSTSIASGSTTTTINTLTLGAASVLASGVTGTTQSAGDNSTKVATTAYVNAAANPRFGLILNTGATGTPAIPNQIAPVSGTLNNCKFLTQASDGSTDLTFNIKFNGTSILNGGGATITHGTASQTITTLTLTGAITVTSGQIWEFDISSGTSTWTGSLVCY